MAVLPWDGGNGFDDHDDGGGEMRGRENVYL
jgi:hypothetical protein